MKEYLEDPLFLMGLGSCIVGGGIIVVMVYMGML